MPSPVFTPKEVAQALGVSESSVKRWVDRGQLAAAKTAGGHRKVPLASVAAFVRRTGQALADPAALGMVATTSKATPHEAVSELFDNLIAGRESAVRELVLGYYQRGESIARIGDELIGPAFGRIGDDWEAANLQVHQERRACEVMMAVLHELRRWLEPPGPTAPIALVGTPHQDFAEVPARLVELTLLAVGWRVTMAGSGLPLTELRGAALATKARLICVSATHLTNLDWFIAQCNNELVQPLQAASRGGPPPKIVVGGTALPCDVSDRLEVDLVGRSLAELVGFQASLDESARA